MLSTRQVAERLGVSEASVRRWSDSGHLPVQRVGKRRERRFHSRDVDAAQRRHPAASPPPKPAAPNLVLAGQVLNVPVHVPAFYDSDAGRVRLTAPFLAEGIKAGQPCFLLAQGEELNSYLVALDADPDVDLDAALASGLLTVVGAPGKTVAEALEFWERKLWDALDGHATLMRAVGEMVSERAGFESEHEMLGYEAAFNMTARRFPCAVICQYDVRKFSGRAILAALRAHPDVLDVSLSLLIK
jgi:excisionase family DNA binding protein